MEIECEITMLRIDNSGWRPIKLTYDISGSQQGILTNKSLIIFLYLLIYGRLVNITNI